MYIYIYICLSCYSMLNIILYVIVLYILHCSIRDDTILIPRRRRRRGSREQRQYTRTRTQHNTTNKNREIHK